MNYFTIILGDLSLLIETFESSTMNQIMCFDYFKDFILKFDKLRGDYLNKLKVNATTQALTKENIEFLSLLFIYLTFILTRFGRIISYFDALESQFNKRQFRTQISIKQAPAIQKVQQIESFYVNDFDQQHQQKMISQQHAASQITALPKSPPKYGMMLNDKNGKDKLRDILNELNEREKQLTVTKFMRDLANRWREQNEICLQEFFADKEIEHSKYCMEKINKQTELDKSTQKFLYLSNEATKSMLQIEKTNQHNTPSLSHSAKLQIYNTPTLGRRKLPILNTELHKTSSFNSDAERELPRILPGGAAPMLSKSSFFKESMDGSDTSSPLKKQLKKSTFQKNQDIEDEDNNSEEKEELLEFTQVQTKKEDKKPFIPTLDLKQGLSQKPQEVPNPLQILSMYSQRAQNADKNVNALNQQSARGQPAAANKVLKATNTLRGFEANKDPKPFQSIKPVQSKDSIANSASCTSLAEDSTLNKEEIIIIKEESKELKLQTEEIKVQQEEVKVSKEEIPKVQLTKAPSLRMNDFMKFDTVKKEEKKSNILQTFGGLRKEVAPPKEEKKEPLYTTQAKSSISFFKKQQLEEKKNKDDTIKVITTIKEKPSTTDISAIVLASSPYLQPMKNTLRQIAHLTEQTPKMANMTEVEKKTHHKSLNSFSSSSAQITSPFIGVTDSGLTKEQKLKLRDHIMKEINTGMNTGDDKKDQKLNPTSNAFTITIKNYQREEVLRNMENLRKSVKLQKRANPLEKLMARMIKNEHDTPKQQPKPNTQLKSMKGLQSIEEEDQQKLENPMMAGAKAVDSIKKIDKKLEQYRELKNNNNLTKQLCKMSPLIQCRPLNTLAEKSSSSSNSLMNTPKLETSDSKNLRESLNKTLSDDGNKTEEMLNAIRNIQNAKKELDILESLKSMSKEIYDICNRQKSYKQQIKLFEMYLRNLKALSTQNILGSQFQRILKEFQDTLQIKIQQLLLLDEVEHNYYKTLPINQQKMKKEEEKVQEHRLKRVITQSINAREDKHTSFTNKPFFVVSPKKSPSSKTLGRRIENQQQFSKFQSIKNENTNRGTGDLFEISHSPSSIPSDSPSLGQTSLSSFTYTTPQQLPRQISEGARFILPPALKSLANLSSPQIDNSKTLTTMVGQQTPFQAKNQSIQRKNTSGTFALDEIKEEVDIMKKKKSQFNIEPQEEKPHDIDGKGSSSSLESIDASPQILPEQSSNNLKHILEMPRKPNSLVSELMIDKKKNFRQFRKGNPSLVAINRVSKFAEGATNQKAQSDNHIRNLSQSNDHFPLIKYQRKDQDYQSDIVVGQHYYDEELQDDDRQCNSDWHDLAFVNDLFQDEDKFKEFIDGVHEQDAEEEEDVLTMKSVRFNSLCILPSQIEACSLEHQSQKNEISINDFILIKTVSKGAYGKVILARKKNTKDLFAIKVLDKEKMIEKNVIEYVMNERDILNTCNNDYIVRGVYTFQSKQYLYMVMEFMKGGDFSHFLENVGYFDQKTAQFYLAQIVLALEYLHKNGIIHRDMKPDNILIDADGHIKLTDFGLSEAGLKNIKQSVINLTANEIQKQQSMEEEERFQIMNKEITTYLGLDASKLKKSFEEEKQEEVKDVQAILNKQNSLRRISQEEEKKDQPQKRILGTADYMAPEVIKGEDHTYLVDFWSVGVIAYEFLTGSLPFNDDSAEKVFKKILRREIRWPDIGTEDGQITPEAYDFMNKLMQTDQKLRLGSNGINEVKNHPFFLGINWDKIKEEVAPFIPHGRDIDTDYFPKANEQDEDLKIIVNDKKQISTEKVKGFQRFGGVSYNTLSQINAKEAKKAMDRKQRQVQQTPALRARKPSFFQESILYDSRKGIQNVDAVIEQENEASLTRNEAN